MLDIYSGGWSCIFCIFSLHFLTFPKLHFLPFLHGMSHALFYLFSTLRIFIGEGLSPTAHSGLPERGGCPSTAWLKRELRGADQEGFPPIKFCLIFQRCIGARGLFLPQHSRCLEGGGRAWH